MARVVNLSGLIDMTVRVLGIQERIYKVVGFGTDVDNNSIPTVFLLDIKTGFIIERGLDTIEVDKGHLM